MLKEKHQLTFEKLYERLDWLEEALADLLEEQQEVCTAAISLQKGIGDTVTTALTVAERKEIEGKFNEIRNLFSETGFLMLFWTHFISINLFRFIKSKVILVHIYNINFFIYLSKSNQSLYLSIFFFKNIGI